MTFGQILLTTFGIGISLFFIIYYVLYRCLPWQKEMHAIMKNYSWGDNDTASFQKNSSCRGICCVDTYRSDTNWYSWIIMFDQDGEMYSQYIRNAKPTGWKKVFSA